MISPDAAWQTIRDLLRPLPPTTRPLAACLGAYLAEPVCADRDLPPTDRAAMDGYALRSADAASAPTVLRLVGEVAAGSALRPELPPDTCVRIMTGAVVPPEADAVVRIEETTADGEQITVLAPVRPRQDILGQGENARAGSELLAAGCRLDPAALALCAAVGCAAPSVGASPDIGLITTGSELLAAEALAAPHQIRDANGPLLAASLAAHGFGHCVPERVADDRALVIAAFARSLAANPVTIVSGGVSVGRYDFVPEAVRELGGTVVVHGVAMKPGKPFLFATCAPDRFLFGLPGNPLAVLNGLHEFVLPALRRLSGCPADACRPLLRLPLAQGITVGGGRRQYRLARLVTQSAGSAVEPIANSGSSDFVAAGRASGMILSPEMKGDLPAGTLVDFRPWAVW